MSNQPYLEVRQLQLSLGGAQLFSNLDFQINRGEIACLLGPSGCGKTSVLRAIAGFLEPDAGSILLHGKEISTASYCLAPEKRHVSMVFQDYALFPHMTVEENIGFGLNKLGKLERREKCESLLSLTRLEHLSKRYPHELSGGQQQRVALARSLATSPDMLLLDEPFSGLDTELRRDLSLRVRDLLKSQEITTLIVTHDQEEAFTLGDKIGVLAQGNLHQWAAPYDLYHKPETRFVADFVGRGSFLPGTAQENTIITELGTLTGQPNRKVSAGQSVQVLLRPDDIVLDKENGQATTICDKHFMGTNTLYKLRLPSGDLVECNLPSHEDFPVHSTLKVRVEADHLILFD
jgi:iron(III) transport system ATP-binding protein